MSPPESVEQPLMGGVKTTIYERYNAKRSLLFGVVQILLGLVMMMLETGAIAIDIIVRFGGPHMVGTGIWCGAFFLVSGGVSIAARNRNKNMVIANLILSLVATVCAIIALIFSSIGVDDARWRSFCDYDEEKRIEINCSYGKQFMMMMSSIALVLVSLAEIVVTILTAINCGLAIPSCNPGNRRSNQSAPTSRKQVVVLPNEEGVYIELASQPIPAGARAYPFVEQGVVSAAAPTAIASIWNSAICCATLCCDKAIVIYQNPADVWQPSEDLAMKMSVSPPSYEHTQVETENA